MKVENNSYFYKNSFHSNLKSPKLKFKQEDFFVKIRGYGKNKVWAKKIKETADISTKMICNNTSFENILKYITAGVIKANSIVKDLSKVLHSGILRIKREGWKNGSDWDGFDLCTNYSNIKRYKTYQNRLDKTSINPLKNPYKEIELTVPKIDKEEHYLQHADSKYVNKAINLICKKYSEFKTKFNSKNVNTSQMEEINNSIAEIRWILAHSTPWERGSDAISNVFIRAMYKSLGIKSYPLKKGISLDLEAYCTELSEYKQKFPTFFEKPPEIIE